MDQDLTLEEFRVERERRRSLRRMCPIETLQRQRPGRVLQPGAGNPNRGALNCDILALRRLMHHLHYWYCYVVLASDAWSHDHEGLHMTRGCVIFAACAPQSQQVRPIGRKQFAIAASSLQLPHVCHIWRS